MMSPIGPFETFRSAMKRSADRAGQKSLSSDQTDAIDYEISGIQDCCSTNRLLLHAEAWVSFRTFRSIEAEHS